MAKQSFSTSSVQVTSSLPDGILAVPRPTIDIFAAAVSGDNGKIFVTLLVLEHGPFSSKIAQALCDQLYSSVSE